MKAIRIETIIMIIIAIVGFVAISSSHSPTGFAFIQEVKYFTSKTQYGDADSEFETTKEALLSDIPILFPSQQCADSDEEGKSSEYIGKNIYKLGTTLHINGENKTDRCVTYDYYEGSYVNPVYSSFCEGHTCKLHESYCEKTFIGDYEIKTYIESCPGSYACYQGACVPQYKVKYLKDNPQ